VNDGLDTLLIATSRAPTRARVLGAATTAAFGAATTYALTDESSDQERAAMALTASAF